MELPEVSAPGLIQRGWKAWIVVVGLGVCGLLFSSWHTRLRRQNDPLAIYSYDLSHQWQPTLRFSNALLLEIDADSLRELGRPIPRNHFARVVELANRAGARLIFFDLVFDEKRGDEDAMFSGRLQSATNVMLGGALHRRPIDEGIVVDAARDRVEVSVVHATAPQPVFGNPSLTNWWGLLDLEPDSDETVRRLQVRFGRHPDFVSAAWRAARVVTNTVRQESLERWYRYYGPPGTAFRHRSLSYALANPGVFEGIDLVFVGVNQASQAGSQSVEIRDQHPGPYGKYYSGLELQAMAVLNLVRNETLARLPLGLQIPLALAWGTLATLLVTLRKTWWMAIVLLVLAFAFAVGLMSLGWRWHHWWPWLIPVGIQTVAALGSWSLIPEAPLGSPVVFISYCAVGAGEINARALEQGLGARRIAAYLAPGRIPGGADLEQLLHPIIRKTPHYLLVLTPTARNELRRAGSWVRKEYTWAQAEGRTLIVVRTKGGSSTFTTDDIRNLEAFLRRLRDERDKVSTFLWKSLSDRAKSLVVDFLDRKSPSANVETEVTHEIWSLLKGRSLYDKVHFEDVTLSERTQELLAEDPVPGACERLNRSLLQDAYPQELYGPDDYVAPADLPGAADGSTPHRTVHQVTFDPGQGFSEAMRQIVAGLKTK